MQFILNVWKERVLLFCTKITFIVKFTKFLYIFHTTVLKCLSFFFEHNMSILCSAVICSFLGNSPVSEF